jgi:hypothetical protein
MTRQGAVWRTALLAIIVSLPAEGYTQVLATNFRELRLKAGPGDTLYITDQSGREFSSKVIDLSETLLAVRVAGKRRDLTEADVTRIRQRQPDALWAGALIGFGVGAGFGAVPASFDEGCRSQGGVGGACAGPILSFGLLGAGVEVGIDALIKGRKVIYEAPGITPNRVTLQPIVSPSVRGVRLTIPF